MGEAMAGRINVPPLTPMRIRGRSLVTSALLGGALDKGSYAIVCVPYATCFSMFGR